MLAGGDYSTTWEALLCSVISVLLVKLSSFGFVVITIIIFDLSGRIRECGSNVQKVLSNVTLGKENPTVSFLLLHPTTTATCHGQSQCEVAFLRYSHTLPPTPVMGPSCHTCKLNPWCHFLLDDVMWWDCDCVAWRGVDWYLSILSLLCPLYISIRIYCK